MTPPAPDLGEFAPWFVAATHANPRFNFSTLAGRYVLLGFLPEDAAARERAMAALGRLRARFDDAEMTAFMVTSDRAVHAAAGEEVGLRWFLDETGAIRGAFGGRAQWVLMDPALRLLDRAAMADSEAFFARLAATPPVEGHAGVDLVAPVLIVPRVFEPALCRQLIQAYETAGGEPSGVMRDIDGRTVGMLDSFKRRKDVMLGDPGLIGELETRLRRRLLPAVRKAFQFEATRIERFTVACYDAADGGYFRPHRDNETLGTAHRRYAASINLNAEAFEGGDLRFPEFGWRSYRPPTGGAVVFCCSLQHEATPVLRGRRYAFLPFFYDEAGAALRDGNRRYLGQNPAASR